MSKYLPVILPTQKVLDKFRGKNNKFRTQFEGIRFRPSKMIRFMLAKGCKCDVCGTEVTHFKIEIQTGSKPGLVPICTNGQKLTLDHTVPRCIGGPDKMDNMVPLCHHCNSVWKNRFDKILLEESIYNLTEADIYHG